MTVIEQWPGFQSFRFYTPLQRFDIKNSPDVIFCECRLSALFEEVHKNCSVYRSGITFILRRVPPFSFQFQILL